MRADLGALGDAVAVAAMRRGDLVGRRAAACRCRPRVASWPIDRCMVPWIEAAHVALLGPLLEPADQIHLPEGILQHVRREVPERERPVVARNRLEQRAIGSRLTGSGFGHSCPPAASQAAVDAGKVDEGVANRARYHRSDLYGTFSFLSRPMFSTSGRGGRGGRKFLRAPAWALDFAMTVWSNKATLPVARIGRGPLGDPRGPRFGQARTSGQAAARSQGRRGG